MNSPGPDPFRAFVEAIVRGETVTATAILSASPELARLKATFGADRENARDNFFEEISHYIYGGDTALHMAAAGFRTELVADLIGRGSDVRARNRRGAEPLHYACDCAPGAPGWNPSAQATTIRLLLEAGADANALDKSGVAPLHRAVRARSAAAVDALIQGGADVMARNGSGSTPFQLATLNTGRSGSGSLEAKEQQMEIIRLLKA